MRIAVIGARGPTPAHEGIQQALEEICPRLSRRGHQIDVFSERNGRSLGDIEGVRMIRLPTLPMSPDLASAHALLSSLLSSMRGYDIVNFWAAGAGGLFTLAAKFGLHRTVVTVHGLDRADPTQGIPLLAPDAIAARFADAITVVSRRLERHFREMYGRETFYIPNGFSPSPTRPTIGLLAEMGLSAGGYILLADRLVPGSGVHDAVTAASVCGTGINMVIAETGEADATYRERVIRDAPADQVRFLGPVSDSHLDALIANSYLFLLPSLTDEPSPMLLRALAQGRAVLVSDQPEFLDMVGADGFTFTCGDVGDLKRVLLWLLNDAEVVAGMESRVAASAAQRYCWDHIAEAYETVYTSVL